MNLSKSSTVWGIVTFCVGIILGSGSLWQWQQKRIDKQKYELEVTKSRMELRQRINETLARIIDLSDKFVRINASKEMSQYEKQGEVDKLGSQLRLLKDDFLSFEKQLSVLENRKARQIQIDFFVPPVPTGMKIVP